MNYALLPAFNLSASVLSVINIRFRNASDHKAWPRWPHAVEELKAAQSTIAAGFDLAGRMPSYLNALCTAWKA